MKTQANIKTKTILAVAGIYVVALVIAGMYRGETIKTRADPNQILTVSQVITNPDQFQERIRIKGTVSNVYPDKSIFALSDLQKAIDRKADAKKTDSAKKKGCCPAPRIPVKYDGPLPELQANVLIEGKIINNENGKKYFQAQKITKL